MDLEFLETECVFCMDCVSTFRFSHCNAYSHSVCLDNWIINRRNQGLEENCPYCRAEPELGLALDFMLEHGGDAGINYIPPLVQPVVPEAEVEPEVGADEILEDVNLNQAVGGGVDIELHPDEDLSD